MLTESWKLFKVIKLIGVLSMIQLWLHTELHISERQRHSVEHTLAHYMNQHRACRTYHSALIRKHPYIFSINNKTNYRILGNGKRQSLFSKQGKEGITSKYVKYKILYFKVNRHVLILE